jgi:hypothetical protein
LHRETVGKMGTRVIYVGGTSLPLAWVVDDDWIDFAAWTGRSENTLPTALREPEDRVTRVTSLMAQIGDVHCDPRSGGIAGHGRIGSYYGVGEQQFRRYVVPTLDYVRWLSGIPITNVASAQADGLRYRARVNATRRANLSSSLSAQRPISAERIRTP